LNHRRCFKAAEYESRELILLAAGDSLGKALERRDVLSCRKLLVLQLMASHNHLEAVWHAGVAEGAEFLRHRAPVMDVFVGKTIGFNIRYVHLVRLTRLAEEMAANGLPYDAMSAIRANHPRKGGLFLERGLSVDSLDDIDSDAVRVLLQ